MSEEIETETITYTRKKKAINKKPIAFKINKILLEQLDQYAVKKDMKKVDIIENALKEYFDNN